MRITLSFKIAEMRKQKNMSVRQLSLYSGVSKTHINEIERGNRVPSVEILCMLALAMKVRPEELYEYTLIK